MIRSGPKVNCRELSRLRGPELKQMLFQGYHLIGPMANYRLGYKDYPLSGVLFSKVHIWDHSPPFHSLGFPFLLDFDERGTFYILFHGVYIRWLLISFCAHME